MEQITYNSEKMALIRDNVQKLIEIVAELEAEFPGRHFTLDGHIFGSIGEILAAYYYGIDLYNIGGKITVAVGNDVKITQQDNITISAEPDYLIVLYMNKNGNIYEVYNGPGNIAWESASKADSHNNHHMRVNRLMKLDADVCADDRIIAINPIEKLKVEFKNKK